MDDKGKKALMLVGLGVGVSASAVLLYYLMRKDENDSYGLVKDISGISTSQQSIVKVRVPRDLVGTIIGRQGATIKQLQEKTNSRIRFDDTEQVSEDVLFRTLVIRGSATDTEEAQNLILEMIHDQPKVLSEEIYIPVRACGRIIGRNGETIRSMCHISQAKIVVDRGGNERDPDNMKRVTLRGTKEQIETAISLIDEKLAEDEAFRQKVALSASGRLARYSAPQKMITMEGNETTCKKKICSTIREQLISNVNDSYIDVFVSSVINPSKFWVQLVGGKSVDLDKLVEEMTDFYEVKNNREQMPLESPVVGEVVAAPFMQDDSWYRARVTDVLQDDYSPVEAKVVVYYEDFGDMCTLSKRDCCKLDTRWSNFPYQGIECRLASIKGTLPDGSWSQQATDRFKELTYAAQWKVVLVRPLKSPDVLGEGPYLVDLMDTNGEKDLNVPQEMISQNLALPDSPNSQTENGHAQAMLSLGTMH